MYELNVENSVILVIDIQERLIPVMKEKVFKKTKANVIRLLESADILNVPVLATQQYTKGLGNTDSDIMSLIKLPYIEKITFSCCGEPNFNKTLKDKNIKNVIVTGMEAHICVLQTVVELLKYNFNVHVVSDAVISREKFNWKTGLEYMRDAGAIITVTETVLFQLLKKSGTSEFKQITKLIK
jgi:nicotinamidase-related amidase